MNTTVSWWLKHPCLVLFCMSVWMFMCLNVFVIGAMSKTIVCNPCVSDKYYYRILSSPNHRPLLWIPHHLFSFCAGISDMTRETHYDSTLKKLEQSLSPSAGQVGDYAGSENKQKEWFWGGFQRTGVEWKGIPAVLYFIISSITPKNTNWALSVSVN